MGKYIRLKLKAELEVTNEEYLLRNLIETIENLGVRVVTIELNKEEKNEKR